MPVTIPKFLGMNLIPDIRIIYSCLKPVRAFFYYKIRNKLNLIIVERKIIKIQYKGQVYQLFLAFLHFRHEYRKVLGKVRTMLFLDLR